METPLIQIDARRLGPPPPMMTEAGRCLTGIQKI